MRISDGRYDRDKKRYELARRMIQYDVRTGIIKEWTGLSTFRIQKFIREYHDIGGSIRHRGVSPFQPSYFFESVHRTCETVALARLQLDMLIVPSNVPRGESLDSVTRGEMLLNAFELYHDQVKSPEITLEHAVLLAKELAYGSALKVARCSACRGINVMEIIGSIHELCVFCRLELPGETDEPR